MNDKDTSSIRKNAEEMFMSGALNCAESSLSALAKMQEIRSPTVPDIAFCFGGGMSITGGTCGALTGAVMGLGLAFNRSNTEYAVPTARVATQRLVREFEQSCGATTCHGLLGYDPKDPESHQVFNREGRKESCAAYVGQAVEMAARIIVEKKS